MEVIRLRLHSEAQCSRMGHRKINDGPAKSNTWHLLFKDILNELAISVLPLDSDTDALQDLCRSRHLL